MSSPPRSDLPCPRWWGGSRAPSPRPFALSWYCKETFAFTSAMYYVRNPLDGDEPVLRARDGQEIGSRAGRRLLDFLGARVREMSWLDHWRAI
ncbi:hypothetical protein GGS23DRAFT_586587 [Durotheca rogersii]|uniref:uncharacterized protein n=1 Tax=Durotheca rogersii TaxID=419775 RepID=UPI00221EEB3E|nr:uncharacterized protein GGS23DRAFT_586587 [Durotheca rogersii]KAI5859314.1 hypothetical protein GGS23DRAFT_586587 [Durotheca rogersii]